METHEKMTELGVPIAAPQVMNLTSIHEDVGLILGRAQGVKDPEWLGCRLAAVAPSQPLAWELPYTMGAVVKKKKNDDRGRPR